MVQYTVGGGKHTCGISQADTDDRIGKSFSSYCTLFFPVYLSLKIWFVYRLEDGLACWL